MVTGKTNKSPGTDTDGLCKAAAVSVPGLLHHGKF